MRVFKQHLHLSRNDNNQWVIRREGEPHYIFNSASFQEAWRMAWKLAEYDTCEIFVHRIDGTVERRMPFPSELLTKNTAKVAMRFTPLLSAMHA